MDQLITIDVLGKPFTFKADANVEDAKAVADFVVEAVGKVESLSARKSPVTDNRAILILTALNITSEYLVLKRKHQQLLRDLGHRSETLLNSLEKRLPD